MSETNYCAKHPDTETNLRCGRCEKLVCPRCMVHSPVGVRCPECAQVRKLPTFEVSGPYMARAIAAGLVLGVAGGVAYTIILWLIPFLSVFALLGAGYLIAEGISVAVNRKRGRPLKYVAAGSVLVTIIIASVPGLTLFGLLGGAIAVYVAVNRF